jgi:hypothetical protein
MQVSKSSHKFGFINVLLGMCTEYINNTATCLTGFVQSQWLILRALRKRGGIDKFINTVYTSRNVEKLFDMQTHECLGACGLFL